MKPLTDAERWVKVLDESIANGSTDIGGVWWTRFSRGPFTAAYPNFPFGLDGARQPITECINSAVPILRAAGVDLLRLSAPECTVLPGLLTPGSTSLVETSIADLQAWDVARLAPETRRKLRRCVASGLTMRPVDARDGEAMYRLYRATLARRRAVARYTPAYFDALCRAALEHPAFLAGKVMHGGDTAGFIVVRHDATTSYYLHGGYDEMFASLRPGYMAMVWALQQCRARGASRFEFLASPADQPGLRRYKESFGGTSRVRVHWDLPLTASGRVAALLIRQANILSARWQQLRR